MRPTLGTIALGLSACGYPLTQVLIRRWGLAGAAVAEAACTGLALRDGALLASGVTRSLRRAPAVLLGLEFAAALAAAAAGSRPLLRVGQLRPDPLEITRRAAVATLFGLHTIRFWIYLQPDQGRRHR